MSSQVEWLIAGLGNPGKRYALTRHNIGWMVVSALGEKYNSELKSNKNIYMEGLFNIKGKSIAAIIPTTFMNNSGEAVLKAAKKFDVPFDRIITIFDEYNFPLGRIHLKIGGSDGGHNGVESIINHLGTDRFYRLRCGISKNFSQGGMVDYVLSSFDANETKLRDEMIKKAVESIEYIMDSGIARAMSLINSGRLWDSDS
jgi:PTH1 family peptidyl-tRNA hydrolase